MLSVGQQIYLRRLERDWTQSELARRAEIPQPNLSDIEKGKRDLTVTMLRRIAYALEVPVVEFFEEPSKAQKRIFSRSFLQKIAQAAARGSVSLSAEEKRIVSLFQDILPGKNQNQIRIKKMYHSWLELKKQFRSEQINTLCERVQELKRIKS